MSPSASSGDVASLEKEDKPDVEATAPGAPPSPPNTPSPPDGGRRAWLTVAGASAAMFASFGWCNCIGLFQAYYEENQLRAYRSSEVSWITSMEFFFMLAFSPLGGKLFDNYGPAPSLVIGTFLHVFGLMMTSLSTQYYQLMLAQSVCSGIGTSLIFAPAMAAPQTFFRAKRGIASGLVTAGSSLGGVVFPLMVQHLIPQVGFGWTMRICSFLILGLMLFSILVLKSNLIHTPRRFAVMDYLRPLREPNFAILTVACFFMYWALFVPFNDIVIVAQYYGTPAWLALSLVPILNGASFVGRVVPNLIADKLGRFTVTTFMTVLSAILCLALWLPGRGSGASVAFAALFGISSGCLIGLGPVLIVAVSPLNELGTRIGTVVAVASIGALTSPPIGNTIAAAAGGTYVYTALFAGLNFLVAAACVWWLRVRLGGWTMGTKV